jgi:hypothetical protein
MLQRKPYSILRFEMGRVSLYAELTRLRTFSGVRTLLVVSGFDFGTGIANEHLVLALLGQFVASYAVFGLDALLKTIKEAQRGPDFHYVLG